MTDGDLQQKRIVAGLIDMAILMAITVVMIVLTTIVGMAGGSSGVLGFLSRVLMFVTSVVMLGYTLGRDVVAGDRSIGKKIQNIRVVTTSGGPVTFHESARRNAIFAIGAALFVVSATLGLIPFIGGILNCLLTPLMILGGLVSVGAAIYEILQITQEPNGIRFGDKQAGTRVVR
jgi:uncharacterized RDD family membrane protein YckC